MNRLCVAAAICIAAVATSQAQATDSQQDAMVKDALTHCDRDQLSMNLCSGHEYQILDTKLNGLYRQVLSKVHGSPREQRLIAAERAWLKYVEADCLYQNGPREESGTIWPLQQYECLSAHTRQRIALLESFIAAE
jgi:uncharacterized protein YecT (DUF1311 family)